MLRLSALVATISIFIGVSYVSKLGDDASNLVSKSSVALADRFQSSGNLLKTITTENERWIEVGFFFEDADAVELAIGKGFGGAVEVPWWWPVGMEITESGRTYYGIYSMHIGLTHALLKGGLLFWLLFFGGWVVFLYRFRRYKDDPRALAAWGVLLLNLLFMTVETLWGPGNVVLVMLLGFCVGYLSQRRFWETPQPSAPAEPS